MRLSFHLHLGHHHLHLLLLLRHTLFHLLAGRDQAVGVYVQQLGVLAQQLGGAQRANDLLGYG